MDEQHHQAMTHDRLEEARQQAHEHLDAHRWSQAGEAFLALLDRDADDEDALLGVAQALDAINSFESLYSTAQHILELTPNSAQGLAYKARALQKMERISEATIANDQALLLDSKLGLAWINRSGLQLLTGKFPDALRSAYRAIGLAPTDARAWANRGVALVNFNRLAEALEAFDRSLELDPTQLFALQMKGDILCRIGRMREVVPLVRDALAHHPTDLTLLTQGIQALRTLEMYEGLKELSSALLQLKPDSQFAWENYARSLRGLGLFTEANEALNHLLEAEPSDVRLLTMKADTLYRLERYREASSIAERARRINPDYPPARRIHEKALRLMYQRKERKSRE